MGSRKTECVKVAVRCRPLLGQEIEDQRQFIVDADQQRGEVSIVNPKTDAGEPPKAFSFDSVYSHECTQEEVYLDTGYPIIECVLEGYNGTIFAYGQTGSGKTHTMTGKGGELRGIIPRGFEQIFYGIELKPDVQFLVRVSYLEIYNEEIYDLLATNPTNNKLQMRENSETGCYVKDLQSLVVKSIEEMQEIQNTGLANRHIGSHKLNRESSRSHSNFTITIETAEIGEDKQQHFRVGKLNLVDLAGSERQSKTEATGDRLKEATNINKSLLTLGIVITALVDGQSTHVPYRDSKLTRLLQESLGGNSKTVMIANCGPADWNYDETISTLRYASRAKNIKCKPKINEDPKDAMLRELQEEMAALRAQLEMAGGVMDPEMMAKGGMIMNAAEPQIIEVEKIVEVYDSEKTAEMEAKLEREREAEERRIRHERRKVEKSKNMAEAEKERILKKLERKEEKKEKAKEKQHALIKKLKSMEEQMVRGNQMVEQATRQEQELQRANAELDKQKRKEQHMERKLRAKEQDWAGLEQKFSSQQEEIEDKAKKLKKLFQKYQAAGTEIIDLQHEFQREREDMVDTIRILTRQLQLRTNILEHFVPADDAKRMEARAQWNEDLDEWTMERFDPATGASLTRPTSSVGLKRPTSEYARIARGLNDGNARFKQEDILSLDLDLPERTIEEYTGIINPKIQTTVQAVLNDIEDDMLFVPIDSASEKYFDPEADRQARQAKRVQSARRPQTAPRKKAEPAGQKKFPQARGLVAK